MTRAETAAFLREHDNYCILTHRRPDGDTIGSSAALCLGLRAMGKTAAQSAVHAAFCRSAGGAGVRGCAG